MQAWVHGGCTQATGSSPIRKTIADRTWAVGYVVCTTFTGTAYQALKLDVNSLHSLFIQLCSVVFVPNPPDLSSCFTCDCMAIRCANLENNTRL